MYRIANWSLILIALAACNGANDRMVAGSEYVKAHTIRELMLVVVEPQAQVIWDSAGTIVNATGEHDLAPTTDEGWLTTQSAAATVAEIGNVLMMPQYASGRGDDWLQFATALVEIGLRAEKAAVDRDVDAILNIGGTMYNVCSACHQMYPPAAE